VVKNQGEAELEEIVGLLLQAPFNYSIELLGYSGFSCSTSDIQFSVTNCYTSDYKSCSSVVNINTISTTMHDEEKKCIIEIPFPQTVSPPASIDIYLPYSFGLTAIGLQYKRIPGQSTEPSPFLQGESISRSVFSFVGVARHLDSRISNITAKVSLIPYLYLVQVADFTANFKNVTGYVSATTIITPQLISVPDSIYSGPFSRFNIHLDLTLNEFYVINTEQRAVQFQELVLTLVLGMIAVLHVLELIESGVDKVIFWIKQTRQKKKHPEQVRPKSTNRKSWKKGNLVKTPRRVTVRRNKPPLDNDNILADNNNALN